MGTKGARLTTYITLPSRYLVYMPQGRGVGVSARIENESERERLRAAVLRPASTPEENAGFIVRTAAEDAPAEALARRHDLSAQALGVRAPEGTADRPGNLVHADLPLHLRVLRDLLRAGRRSGADRSAERAPRDAGVRRGIHPGDACRASSSTAKARPIFELHHVEEEIHKALDRKVPLKSGGHLIIDQTESMTTIDVNTGAFVGHRNLEETIFRTNLEAAVAIARQLRLRNLGGIIIIDFIDMEEPEHRRQVIQALEKALERRSRQDQHLLGVAVGAGRDDAQTHAREPGTSAVPALSHLRRDADSSKRPKRSVMRYFVRSSARRANSSASN